MSASAYHLHCLSELAFEPIPPRLVFVDGMVHAVAEDISAIGPTCIRRMATPAKVFSQPQPQGTQAAHKPQATTPPRPPPTTLAMSANFNPYVQGWRVGNAPSNGGGGSGGGTPWGNPSGEPPSVFGALPGGQSGRAQHSPPAPGSTVFFITDFRPNVLNASVVDARGRQCYKIVTDASQPNRTVYYDVHRRTVALVDWAGPRTAVEMPGLLPRQALRSWLHTASDRAYVPPSKPFLSLSFFSPLFYFYFLFLVL